MRSLVSTLVLLLALVSACGDDDGMTTPPPPPPPPADTGPEPDSGPVDSGTDSGPVDSGPVDAGPPPGVPDRYCPGGEGCPDEGDGVLYVGAAALTVTPTIGPTTDVQTVDTNGDGEFNPADGDEFDDRNGNGTFDGVWIAGFGNGRAASGVNDDQWARAIALRNGATTLVLVSIDCVGYFKDQMDLIRDALADEDIDYVSVTATHTHEARDTLGIWGVDVGQTGIDPDYMVFLRERTVRAVRDAVAALEPANVQYARFRVADLEGGTRRFVGDARDPYIIDDEFRMMRFVAAGTDTTIATLLNWASHPEYTGDRNQLLSSDYPHWLREGIENGVAGPDGMPVEGVGGIAVFYQGALGAQIGPASDVRLQRFDGTPVETDQREAAETAGTQLAYHALAALRGDGVVSDETAALGFRTRSFFVDVQNRGYHIAFVTGLFQREAYNWDPERALIPGRNEPDILTEVSVIDIGRAQIITIPGELDPALFVGGYDGGYTPEDRPVVDTTLENPPDLSMAPEPPYLRDLAREDAEMVLLFGLTQDMLGYMVPEFDYELDATAPYIEEAPGDHYEETNSVGIDGWPTIRRQIEGLLAWRPGDGS
ncbi:MAG: hypothetical protein IT379_17260 [Deltaproteobacteria bacterium]|nr:hypothetical protein [Deltaproteobacteria bacterium]